MLVRALLFVLVFAPGPIAFAQLPAWSVQGSFAVPSVTNGPNCRVQSADLNVDGKADIVVWNSTNGTGAVLLGQGAGNFSILAGNPAIAGSSAAVENLDSDTFPDLLSGTSIKHGGGNGTFSNPTTPAGFNGLQSPIVHGIADLNGDGLKDIAIAGLSPNGSTHEVRVALAIPGGQFFLPLIFATGHQPSSIQAAEMSNDGLMDIVIACSDSFTIVYGAASGMLSAQTYSRGAPGYPAIGDFTADGIADMILSSGLIVFGAGNGQFLAGSIVVPNTSLRARVFDANGDGFVDIAVPLASNLINVVKNEAGANLNGGFHVNATGPIYEMIVANVTGDPRLDMIVLTDNTGGGVKLVLIKNDAPNCNSNTIDDSVEIALGLVTDCDSNGVPDGCQTDCDNSGTPDVCQIAAQPALDLDADSNLDSCEVVGTAYCFGDGTGAACPCDPGQAGPVGGGCKNSTGGGGRLRAVGNAQVVLDSVTMTASGLDIGSMALLYQGSASQSAGLGSTFGDGLLCVNGTIVRFYVRAADDGSVRYGRVVSGDTPLATLGLLPVGGGTRFYQVWYRDAAAFCSPSNYNLTNGLELAWAP